MSITGGRLVFPWAGLSVKPVEGAAVVWWNLLASHEHDFLTRHASCPILRGHKWIVTKWVGYNAQWNIQPCPLDPSRKITLG
ncbi:Prolyl 4-hydroxylase subunit alpha-1 [Halocaridina rubra]|uniref:Prolyl 4-hydroxylase subunit alpha-1 n=1 Tax=Halocaridina rubra TaxID=373956 RepID=A0AAN9AGJ3_HALRR